jgi:nucleoside-diphosphate-sugar epimerase
MIMQKIIIAGCGYIGARIAKLWSERGEEVTCLVRSPEKVLNLKEQGFQAVATSFDEQGSITLPDLSDSTIFYLVPPPGGGITDTRARNFLDVLKNAGTPAKIIYMSTTSVYGETDGCVVTEESPTEPISAMGKRRLDAEAAFLTYAAENDVPVVILRVSGIYGPGRLPLMQISQGQPLLREEESGPSNRIHADDLVDVCMAAAQYGENGAIFNVSDGNPSSMTTYFNACADALNLPRQQQVTLEEARQVMSPLMFSYVSELRVIDNSRMLERLHIVLRYPSILEGLAASVVGGSLAK